MASIQKIKRTYKDLDTDIDSNRQIDNTFPKFLIVKSLEEKPITTLSPFIIEKQIESLIGTPKTVKKLKNQTILVETTRKSQTESLLKIETFFNIKVSVSEHKTLNSSKGIIKDRALKGETEEDILNYLKPQGVIAVKRFKIKKEYSLVDTNTILLTFNSAILPANLKIFYRIIPVELYIPNPLRCFNCQRFGHHESNCSEDPGSVCERCGKGNHDHHTSQCQNQIKCRNCGKDHLPKSNLCEMWKKEKEIIKIKITKNITYPEARKLFELIPKPVYSKIVQSSFVKPPTKTTSTQYDENDFSKDINSQCSQSSSQTSQTSGSSQSSSQSSQSILQSSQSSSRSTQHSQSSRTSQSSPRSPQPSTNSPQRQSRTGQQSANSNKKDDSNHSRSKSSQRSQSNKKEKDKQHSNRQKKGSHDPIKLANSYESLEDMELDLDPPLTK